MLQAPATNRWILWLLDRLPTWGTKMHQKDWAMGEDHEKIMGYRGSDEDWWQKSGIKKKWHKQRMKLVSVFSGFGYCSRGVGSSSVMYVRQAAHLRH
jgi:hypothetical protein